MAHHIYKLADGSRVPSVTTILSRFKESGGLIHWAWQQGKDGKDYRETRDAAADIGTLAHDMVDCYATGKECIVPPNTTPEQLSKATNAFGAFQEWAGSTQLQIVKSEVPLVSERYKFGGTLDAMLVRGKLSLGDWKSSNKVYGDYLCQIAAYGILWEENFPDQPITGGFHLIRFDKETGDFHHHWYGELDDGKAMFLALREAYQYDYKLKKRAA